MSNNEEFTRRSICFVVSSPQTANAFLINHIRELSKHYFVSLVVNCDESTELSDELTNITNIHHIAIVRRISILQDITALIKLCIFFKNNNFFAVHSVTPKAGLLTMLATRISNVEHRIHIFTGQVWATKTGLNRYILKTIDRITAKCSTNILVDGHSQLSFLHEENVFEIQNGTVLGAGSISGVNDQIFKPSEPHKIKLRSELKLSNEDLIFVYLGRLNYDKGVMDLCTAFSQVIEQTPHTHLLIVGPTESQSVMMKVTALQKLHPNRVHYRTATTTPEYFLSASDVFCLPSHREGFGTSVLEAAACGLPAVVSDVYGLADTIIDDETGLFHKNKDPDSLAKALIKLAKNPKDIEHMGKTARARAIKIFSSESITSKWVEFYKKL